MSFGAATDAAAPTLVIGLGNPILGDDGVGWQVADALERRLAADPRARAQIGPIEIDHLSVGGLRLMERLVGYERVVLVDASRDDGPVGTVRVRPMSDVDSRLAGHLDSAHDATLAAALDAAAALGASLPRELTVVTISAERVEEFGEALTPPVAAAVEPAVDAIVDLLEQQPLRIR